MLRKIVEKGNKRVLEKKILGIMCVLSFCLCVVSSSIPVYGASIDKQIDEFAEGRYANIASYYTVLSLNGSTFTASASVQAKVRASISITMTLQRQSGTSWSDVTSWYSSTTGASLKLTKNYVAGTRGNYRARAVYTVNGETITTYSNVVAYQDTREKKSKENFKIKCTP